MASDLTLDAAESLLLDALRCAVHGRGLSPDQAPDGETLQRLICLAREQAVLPLLVQAAADTGLFPDREHGAFREARLLTMGQAARTAEFLLLLRELEKRDLHPLVLKGMVCRALYPEPEQRASADEDFLVASEDYPAYREALFACGLRLREPDTGWEEKDELAFVDPSRNLCLELHFRPFSSDSAAIRDCNRYFESAQTRTTDLSVYGLPVRTLQPTEHLLFLLCHAYKHLFYSGLGVRQLCDICLFAARFPERIDWLALRRSCGELEIEKLAAAIFRVGERYLDLPVPAAFADPDVDELPLLKDCLAAGVFGAEDPDRRHSSTLTLDAVAAAKQGRARRGLLPALFPSARSIAHRFPYLRKRPWLLPVAWIRRAWLYAAEKKAGPAASLRIARERMELLKQYDLLS